MKVQKVHTKFMLENEKHYTQQWVSKVNNLFSASFFKYALVNLHLEQLWAQSEIRRLSLCSSLKYSLEEMDIQDEIKLITAFSYEGVLFQARAFMDIYMLYICYFLGCIDPSYNGKMSYHKFIKTIRTCEKNKDKCEKVSFYFSKFVFGKENWGSMLRSMRDKIAHRDMMRASYNSSEYIFDNELFDWPTIKDMTIDRLFQSIDTGIFELVQEISEILYDTEWSDFG
jgi:hypothetical protein